METAVASPDIVAWLLAGADPSVRYFTMTELLGASPDAPAARAARREIMTTGLVPRILAAQLDDGHWESRDRFYTAKYRGTVWTLLILAELGADGADPRLRRGCEAVLRDSQDSASGGFATDRAKKTGGGLHSRVIPCLTGNLVYSLIRFGLLEDPRVQAAIDWLTAVARFDDGEDEGPPADQWPYSAWPMCWGRHTCHMGVVKTMKALAEIPEERRSAAVRGTLDAAAEFMLRHHVHKRSHDLGKTAKPGWRRLGFPLMYQTDVLEVLGLLTKLGRAGDERAREARDLVASRADAQGRWKLQQTFNGRFVVDVEVKGEPSRWVTLKALQVV
jgi:hypothetical protein